MSPAVWRVLLGIFFAGVLPGCATAPAAAPAALAPAASQPVTAVLDRLCFGRVIPQGGEVSEADWARFVADTITPRFPTGFTVFQAQGQWRGADGQITREPTSIVEIAHASDAASDRAIVEIALEYKRRFTQEAVLRIQQPVGMTFY